MTDSPDPDKAPEDETQLEQLLELAALAAEDNGIGPADIIWPPQNDDDVD